MYSQHPDIAKRWSSEYGSKIVPSKKLKKDEKKAVAKRRMAKKADEKMAAKNSKFAGNFKNSPGGY